MTKIERKYTWDSKMLNNYFMIQLKHQDFMRIHTEFDKFAENDNLILGGGLRLFDFYGALHRTHNLLRSQIEFFFE